MNTRTTLILAICLAVVALYLVFVAKPWKEPAKPEDVSGKPQDVWTDKINKDDVVRIEVVSARDPRRVFVKKDDKWFIEEPIRAPANKWTVEDMAREIADLKYTRRYEPGAKGRPSNATTQLDKPPYVVTLTTKDNKSVSLHIGANTPTGGNTYVQKAGSDVILVVNQNLDMRFNKRLSDLRDKRVTDFKVEEAVRVKVEGVENFEMVKSNGEWMVESPVRCRADKNKAESVVRALSNIYAYEFTADKPPSLVPYGLSEPRLTATVTIEKKIEKKEEKKEGEATTQPADTQPTIETQVVVVQFGSPTSAKAENYFAKLDREDPVFTVSKTTFTEISPKLKDLRDKKVVKLDPARCTRVEVVLPNERFAFEKKGTAWHYAADGTTAETTLVEDLLKAVRDLNAIQFENTSDLLGVDLDKPRARVTVTQEGELAPITLLVLGLTPSEKNTYVKLATDESVAVVPEDTVAQLLATGITYRQREMLVCARDRISRLEFRREGRRVVLTKSGANWSMIEPVAADADADAVRDALNDLSSLRARKVVGQGNPAAFGLDEPELEVTLTVDPPPPPPTRPATAPSTATAPADRPDIETLRKAWRDSHPGEPLPPDLAEETTTQPTASTAPVATATQPTATQPTATRPAPKPDIHRVRLAKKDAKAYAMVDGRDLVYEVDSKIFDDLAAEMHARTVARLETDKVAGLAFVRGDVRTTFSHAGGKWIYREDTTVSLDEQKIKDAINALRDTKTHRFVSYHATPDDLRKYKLDAPALRVVATVPNAQDIELLISPEGPDNDADKSRWATIAGSNTVFLLKPDQISKLDKKLGDFEKTETKSTASTTPPSGNPD